MEESKLKAPRGRAKKKAASAENSGAALSISSEFKELGLNDLLLHKIAEIGYVTPSEIQKGIIPVLLGGADAIGKAKTGSGKTAAFLLPILQRIVLGELKKVLIISPTRELSMQIYEELLLFSVNNIKGVLLVGGKDMKQQMKSLANEYHIIIATTGRLMDHLQRGNLPLNDIEMVVLDEADRLLDMGFLDETREIMDKAVNRKQTALFSATFNHKVMNLVDQFLKSPKLIEIEEATTIDLKTFQHYFIAVSITRKRALMYTLIKEQKPEKCIIFVRTKSQCKLVYDKLFTKDYKVGLLHGDLPQFKRDKILQQFKAGEFQYFVATDVASRGLHIDGVTHIINFDMPDEVEEYIHRVGRTARMGKSGKAFTFVTKVDGEKFINLEKSLNMQIPEHVIPDFKTGLDEFGNEINIRESEQDDGDEKEDAIESTGSTVSPEITIDSNSKEGSFVYSKTTFETPKGFGQGL